LFGEELGGRFKCSTVDGLGSSKCERHILRTSFLCDGFSVKCLVTDRKKTAPIQPTPSSKSWLDQAQELTRRKRPQSNPLPSKDKIKKIIGVDFGETFTGGFVCKDFELYNEQPFGYRDKGNLQNLTLKSSALNEPTRLFQNWLNHTKTEVCE